MTEGIQTVAVLGAGHVDHGIGDVVESVSDFVSGPPIALKLAKRVVHDGLDASLETGLGNESKTFGLHASTEDIVEGVSAFREDREPDFEGA